VKILFTQGLLDSSAKKLDEIDRETTKDVLSTMIDRITLDPVSMECCIHYQIGVDGRNSVASPRGVDLIPRLQAASRTLNI